MYDCPEPWALCLDIFGAWLMQDRYVGDVGDFGKYGLLRWLCRKDETGPAYRLGVLWYRFEDATAGDGKYIDYLDSQDTSTFRECDVELFEKMQAIVRSERSLESVEGSGVLPDGTVYFSEKLIFSKGEPRNFRCSRRKRWVNTGLQVVADSEIVFADPDTGLQIPSVSRVSLNGPKYSYYDDLLPCRDRGQTLIIYQHIGRRGTADEQIDARLHELGEEGFGKEVAPIVLRFRRGSSRAYIMLPAVRHARRLSERCESFLASNWGRLFSKHALA